MENQCQRLSLQRGKGINVEVEACKEGMSIETLSFDYYRDEHAEAMSQVI